MAAAHGLIFSPPMSAGEDVSNLILDCFKDGLMDVVLPPGHLGRRGHVPLARVVTLTADWATAALPG